MSFTLLFLNSKIIFLFLYYGYFPVESVRKEGLRPASPPPLSAQWARGIQNCQNQTLI